MIEIKRSSYGTWVVTVDGKREYESTNKVKATGVQEYLKRKGIPLIEVLKDSAS